MADIELLAAVPVAPAKDLAATIAFFRDKLGFTEAFNMGEYAGMMRGPIEIHLYDAKAPAADGGKINSAMTIRINVKGVDEIYAAIDPKIVRDDEKLQTMPFGMRQFSVNDPSGNRITFAQRV